MRQQWGEWGDDSCLCKPAKEREGGEPARCRGARDRRAQRAGETEASGCGFIWWQKVRIGGDRE